MCLHSSSAAYLVKGKALPFVYNAKYSFSITDSSGVFLLNCRNTLRILLRYLGIIASDLAEFASLTKGLTVYLAVSIYYRCTTGIGVCLSTYGSLVKWLRHCPFTAVTASSNLPRITSRGFPTLFLPDLLLVPQLGAFRYFQTYVVFSSFARYVLVPGICPAVCGHSSKSW